MTRAKADKKVTKKVTKKVKGCELLGLSLEKDIKVQGTVVDGKFESKTRSGKKKVPSKTVGEEKLSEEVKQSQGEYKISQCLKGLTHWTSRQVNNHELKGKWMAACDGYKYPMNSRRLLNNYYQVFRSKSENYSSNNSLFGFWTDLLSSSMKISHGIKKIRVLDCGAGEGRALGAMIASVPSEKVGLCTGVSMHPFACVMDLLKANPDRLEWYLSKAQDVLPTMKSKSYNLIIDSWGPYFYSADKHVLLNHYHRLLAVGGRAFIVIDRHSTKLMVSGNTAAENKSCSFEKMLCSQYPKIFNLIHGSRVKRWLMITRHNLSPLSTFLDFEIVSSSTRQASSCGTVNYISETLLRESNFTVP